MALKYISHRGNLIGPSVLENHPKFIQLALDKGFDVEIDVWCIDEIWFLGHDFPKYHIDISFLENNKLWCHAKNKEAYEKMLKNKNIHCFWHENDKWVLTSKGIVWCLKDGEIIDNSVAILNAENFPCGIYGNFREYIPNNVSGICSDYIEKIYDIISIRNPA